MPLPGGAQQFGLGCRMPLLAQRLQRCGQQLAPIVCIDIYSPEVPLVGLAEGQTGLM